MTDTKLVTKGHFVDLPSDRNAKASIICTFYNWDQLLMICAAYILSYIGKPFKTCRA